MKLILVISEGNCCCTIEQDSFPIGVSKFTKIVAMHSELVALADNGFIYGWAWDNDGNGSMTAHPFGVMILANVSYLPVSFSTALVISQDRGKDGCYRNPCVNNPFYLR